MIVVCRIIPVETRRGSDGSMDESLRFGCAPSSCPAWSSIAGVLEPVVGALLGAVLGGSVLEGVTELSEDSDEPPLLASVLLE